MKKKITAIILSIIPNLVLAAREVSTGLQSPLGDGAEGSDLKTIFINVIDIAQTIVIMITILYLMYAGLMFVIARGNPDRIKKAKDALFWGIIGAGLVLCAEVIAYGIGDTVREVFKGN